MNDPLHEQHEIFLRCSPALIDHLPKLEILKRFHAADGQELGAKFLSPRSSSALAANVFGIFCAHPELFTLPGDLALHEQPTSLLLEERLRFPWSGGKHPNLDAVVTTASELLAIECKRLEPFDSHKHAPFSEAYSRPEWGHHMQAFERTRDALRSGVYRPQHLDARQLVKHAFGLRTQAHKSGKQPRLLYVYLDGLPDSVAGPAAQALHRREVAEFTARVEGDEVAFDATTYGALLQHWQHSLNSVLLAHVERVTERFGLLGR